MAKSRCNRVVVVCALLATGMANRAFATGVPIGGFLPMVGIALTDEFSDDLNTFPIARTSVTGTLLGAGGVGYYDVALLDTGAAVSLLTQQAFDDFGLGSPSPGEPEGYRGTETIQIGGATGTLLAEINDPLGLYVGGLQGRTSSAPLVIGSRDPARTDQHVDDYAPGGIRTSQRRRPQLCGPPWATYSQFLRPPKSPASFRR